MVAVTEHQVADVGDSEALLTVSMEMKESFNRSGSVAWEDLRYSKFISDTQNTGLCGKGDPDQHQ